MKIILTWGRLAISKARHYTSFLDGYLEEPKNVALKQLVWTADTFTKSTPMDPEEYITVVTVATRVALIPHLTGIKKVVLRKKGLDGDVDDEL